MTLPIDFKEKLIKILNEKGVTVKCELCGQNNWAVADQAVTLNISKLEGPFQIPPPSIPSAALVCNNCGNIRLFALGVLGLLEQKKGGDK